MELTGKRTIQELLKKYNARPEKHLGQHFILSKQALASMVTAAEIPHPLKKGGKLNEIIVEVGPGLGTLTRELAKTGANIVAIEKDSLMVEILKETLSDCKNVKIIQADARQLLMSDINSTIDVGHQYKIVANLPYNAATFLIRQWLESKNPPELMVLMIQKEVARRIVAKPPHSNLLGISVQFYADVKIFGYVPKESFWPKPKVDAAITKIVPKRNEKSGHIQPIGSKQSFVFFRTVKAGFSQPRKQLSGNLAKKLNISKEKIVSIFKGLNISEKVRAENLSLNDWQKLSYELIGQ